MSYISVVIPTYNRANYLPQAIDSVLEQSVPDVEIIVVDDGSTDDTRVCVNAYGDRVRYLYTPNGGVGHARNVGMRAAVGKYLTFLDSDDLYYPYSLELESRVLDRYPPVAMVYSEMSAFDGNGYFDRYHLKKYHGSAYRDPSVTYERMFAESVRLADLSVAPSSLAAEDPAALDHRVYFGNIFDWYLTRLVLFHNSMMIRREIIPGLGERNERVKYWEEMDFALRITRRHQVGFIDVPTYRLRYHEGQISTTARADGKYVWIRKQQSLLRVVQRHAHEDPAYYERNRVEIDKHIANLHRAVAVPLLLSQTGHRTGRYLRAARKYLRRCRQLGHAQTMLWLLSFTPHPLRRLGVSVVEEMRNLRRYGLRRLVARHREA